MKSLFFVFLINLFQLFNCLILENTPCKIDNYELDCKNVNHQIIQLDFSNLESFTNLKKHESYFKYDFSFNKIKNINNVKKLEIKIYELDLSNNEIEILDSKIFENFLFLRKLWLNRNIIEKIDVNSFDGLKNLKYLDLSYNQLTNLDLIIFKNMPLLNELDLSGNQLLSQDSTYNFNFNYFPALEILKLQDCSLKNLKNFVFDQHLKINKLNIGYNLFTNVPNEQLRSLSSLKYLDISSNNFIYNINENDFKKLYSIEILNINNMAKLKRIKEFSFKDLYNLKEFICTYNHLLREIDERAFLIKNDIDGKISKLDKKKYKDNLILFDETMSYSKNLKNVKINNNFLTKFYEKTIKLDNIEKLDISNNPWRCNEKLNFLYDLTFSKKLLNQQQTKCNLPNKYSSLSFLTLKQFGYLNFEKESFIDEEHQAFFGLLCVALISFLIITIIFILKALHIKEKLQKTTHDYFKISGLRISIWNLFNCCGLLKKKGFYKNFGAQSTRNEMEWDDNELQL